MYARQTADDRYPKGLRVPSNYSGNAFRNEGIRNENVRNEDTRDSNAETDSKEIQYAAAETEFRDSSANEHSLPVSAPQKESLPTGIGRIFNRGGGGLGFEELLILGLVFLISQNDSKDDLAFLLLMLLFIQ